MLDIALLTSNASQLKYILQAGDKHEFYHFMLVLVSVSICLQIAQGALSVFLGSIDINKEAHHRRANLAQNGALVMNMVSQILILTLSRGDQDLEYLFSLRFQVSVIINIMINTMEIKSMNGFNGLAAIRKDL